MKISAYTDGACSNHKNGNGPGGWGVVICLKEDLVKLAGYELSTTNNKMELYAALMALRYFNGKKIDGKKGSIEKGDELSIVSDSAYLINAFNLGWIKKWKLNGWKTVNGGAVKNKEIWEELSDLVKKLKSQGVKIKFIKVRGHSGNALNEMADALASEMSEIAQQEE